MTYVSTLADKAILARLRRSMYQPYAFDEKATLQVEAANGVQGAGRFNKRLLKNCNTLKECNSKFNDLYQHFVRHTVPWLDDGVRMLPNAQYFDFAADMRRMIQAANDSADLLAKDWDRLVQDDLQRLGSLGNPKDYPSADELRASFDATIRFFPIPSSNDFRIAVSEEDKADMERAIREAEAAVRKHLMEEMLGPVKKFVEKMSVPIGSEGAIFRDSLVENLQDVVDRLPRLNINNDPDVSQTIEDIQAIVSQYGRNPDVLRESPITRARAHAEMAKVASKMSAFMQGA